MRSFAKRRATIAMPILAVAIASLIGCRQDALPGIQPSAAKREVHLAAEGEPAVALAIDYGDGVEKRFERIPFAEGMTVLGALRFAADHPRGITFDKRGDGELAFLIRIDDLSNQGGGDGRNWLYRVNGNPATKSFDAYVLSAGDVILWKYEVGTGVRD